MNIFKRVSVQPFWVELRKRVHSSSQVCDVFLFVRYERTQEHAVVAGQPWPQHAALAGGGAESGGGKWQWERVLAHSVLGNPISSAPSAWLFTAQVIASREIIPREREHTVPVLNRPPSRKITPQTSRFRRQRKLHIRPFGASGSQTPKISHSKWWRWILLSPWHYGYLVIDIFNQIF